MIEPYFRTIVEYDIKRREEIKEDDKILVQSNTEYLRISISDPALIRQIRVIQIPIEDLLKE